ncbi:MAG: DUF3501 family protein [Alphaproteobacteria bacterium]|nr:DUF3501 family protein [Alphaproteobacteria bacterium]
MKHAITAADILPLDAYEKIRAEKRAAIMAAKKNRRVAVGPYATFYFENYDTMWLQIQEMMRIEKGGDEQLADELRAYNPMIPNGRELTATVMFEIEDETRRRAVLSTLGGVEKTVELRFDGETIHATSEQDLDYTSAEGKASSVQFLHFSFTAAQVLKFIAPDRQAVIAVTHANYGHMAILPEQVRQELARDFDRA